MQRSEILYIYSWDNYYWKLFPFLSQMKNNLREKWNILVLETEETTFLYTQYIIYSIYFYTFHISVGHTI